MNKSQRIHLNTENSSTDKHIKIRLEQEVNSLEFLSMSIGTTDVYQNFNADYGVLVGRVTANDGVGIPNAKISVFIPLKDEDISNGEIVSVYPYTTPRDKNNDGKRYNLLPRVGKKDPKTGVVSPKQPFGSFPIKEEIVTNEVLLNVYKKYYKYTALTNNAGDYMIFGVPTGTQTVHLSADITDIGKYSMNPAAMVVNLGYSPNLFMDNSSKIKPSSDLSDLPNIETQEITVDVIPFWGDTENFIIGITRQDFRIRAILVNTFTIFGTAFTDGADSMWTDNSDNVRNVRELYRIRKDEATHIGIADKRNGIITEKIYYYPADVTDAEITANGSDLKNKMLVLDKSEYSSYKRDGDFVFIINCNRNKIITDDLGNDVPVPSNSTGGVFTTFKGFITFEYSLEDLPMNFTEPMGGVSAYPLRMKLKVPQQASRGNGFDETEGTNTKNWRNQHKTFSGNTIYSVARFHGLVYNKDSGTDGIPTNGFIDHDEINRLNLDPYYNTGVIKTTEDDNTSFQFPSNGATDIGKPAFGANWLNLCLYFPQFGWFRNDYSAFHNMRVATNVTETFKNTSHAVSDNTQEIAAGVFNTKWYGRSDLHWTDFVIVPKTDIIAMNSTNKKGFLKTEIPTLSDNYRKGAAMTGAVGTNTYFYKGLKEADCIEFITSLGLV